MIGGSRGNGSSDGPGAESLGSEAAWVAHGSDGSTRSRRRPTHIAALENGTVRTFEINPRTSEWRAPSPIASRRRSRHQCDGADGCAEGTKGHIGISRSSRRAALIVAGKAKDLKEARRWP